MIAETVVWQMLLIQRQDLPGCREIGCVYEYTSGGAV